MSQHFSCLNLLLAWERPSMSCLQSKSTSTFAESARHLRGPSVRSTDAHCASTEVARTKLFSRGSSQTEFLHARCERAGLNSQQLGGSAAAVNFPPCFVQRRHNVGALGVTYFLLGAHLNEWRITEPLYS